MSKKLGFIVQVNNENNEVFAFELFEP